MANAPTLPKQIKAARALLGWSKGDLERACGVASLTIKGIENGTIIDQPDTAARVRAALDSAGIEFIESGVRLRPTAEGLRTDQLNASNDD
ncbi:helix-turn-helix transcriptional regulator [Xanthobacter sp. DSM 24535]|uniref:helix-turn-helix domain-containing protein n=1 Tax=Roseixanthobacter psychrophilus TaxID=3119917 RepID=UPI00372A0D5E